MVDLDLILIFKAVNFVEKSESYVSIQFQKNRILDCEISCRNRGGDGKFCVLVMRGFPLSQEGAPVHRVTSPSPEEICRRD